MSRKGQITLEAVLLIIAVALGGLAMQGYFKRAIQGNWRANADTFSEEQFESGVSAETVNPGRLTFTAPHITANVTGVSSTQVFDVAGASGSDPLNINNWRPCGTYGN